MAEAPLISAVIPTYNRTGYLESALHSFEHQTLPASAFEVIVVDDGSTDGTGDLCLGWRGRINLRYFKQANSTSSVAKNLGLFVASAPLVFFSDDDDVASETLLEEHVRAHERYPDERTAILNFTTWHPEMAVTPVMDYLVNIGQFLFSYPSIDPEQVLGWQHFWTGRLSCKRRFLTHFGIFSRYMKRVEDIELGYRLARHGLEIRYWPEAKSHMLRPITFRDFCARAEKDGRSLAVFKKLHPAPEIEQYCQPNAVQRWREIEGQLERVVAEVEELEAQIRKAGSSHIRHLQATLHQLYRRGFEGFAVKGVAEAELAGVEEVPLDRG